MANTIVLTPFGQIPFSDIQGTDRRYRILGIGNSYYNDVDQSQIVYLEDTRNADSWNWFNLTYSNFTIVYNPTANAIVRVVTQISTREDGLRQIIRNAEENPRVQWIDISPGEIGFFMPLFNEQYFPTYSDKNLGWYATVLPSVTSQYAPWFGADFYTNTFLPLVRRVAALEANIAPTSGVTQEQLSEAIEPLQTNINNLNTKVQELEATPTGVLKTEYDTKIKELNNAIAALEDKFMNATTVEQLNELCTNVNNRIDELSTTIEGIKDSLGGVTQERLDATIKEINDRIAALPAATTQAELDAAVKEVNDKITALQKTPGITQEQLNAAIKEINDKIAALPTATGGITQEQLNAAIKEINDKIAALPTATSVITQEQLNAATRNINSRGPTFPTDKNINIHQLIGNPSFADGLYMRDVDGAWVA